jgi:hypothetical protein
LISVSGDSGSFSETVSDKWLAFREKPKNEIEN